MPSAIKVKKMAANTWSSENEAETTEEPPATETDSKKTPVKSKKESVVQEPEIIDAKRKRTIPKEELAAADWLKENFEKAEEGALKVMKLYNLFTEMCGETALAVPPVNVFRRVLTSVLGGSQYAVKDSSAYKGVVNEKKKVKKESSEKKSVLTTIKLKIRDHIVEALKEGGSPKKGLRFLWIKQNLMSKFPILRLDIDPLYLKNALERCIGYGTVELAKGMGMAGFYRLPGDYPESEDEKPKKKAKATEKGAGDKDAEKKDGKEGEDKPENGETKEGEEKKKENGKAEETPAEEEKDKKNKKKKSRKSKPRGYCSTGVSIHVEPKTISDVFPMAMTFMSEPKDASASRIKKYVDKYFPSSSEKIIESFKGVLLKGCEDGLWEQVTGSGTQGSYRLVVQDINPLHCDTLEEQICLSILASHEPKQSSVILLRDYILEYHPNFAIDKRPKSFKKAVEKEERKGTIIRLSGLGCTGSFQLAKPFTPSPSWLAGEEEDYESGEDAVDILPYKARPSKRRGRGRVAAACGRQPDFIAHSNQPAKRKSKKPQRKPKVVYAEDSESDDEVAPKKRRIAAKRSSSRSKPAAKKGSRQSSRNVAESEEDEDADEESETETAKSKSDRKRSPQKPKASSRKKCPVKKSVEKPKSNSSFSSRKRSGRQEVQNDLEEGEFHSARSRKRINYSEDQNEASERVKSRQRRSPAKKYKEQGSSDEEGSDQNEAVKSRQRRSPAKKYKEQESSDEEGEVTLPTKRKSSDDESEDERPAEKKSKASSRSKSRSKQSASEDDEPPRKSKSSKSSFSRAALKSSDSEDDEPPAKSRSKGKSSSKPAADSDSEDDELPSKSKSRKSSTKKAEDSEDDETPSKARSRSTSKSSSKKTKASYSDSEDDEPPSKSKSRSRGKSSSTRPAPQSDSEDEEPPSKSRSTVKSSSKRSAAQSDSEEETKHSDDNDAEKSPPKSSKKPAKKSKRRR